jgi:hypothetical protein
MLPNKILKNRKGQSTLEFIMTFSMVFAFFFLFLKTAMNYTDGYMVHYATFMASRAYLSVDPERQKAEEADEKVFEYSKLIFKKYLPDGLIKGYDGVTKANSPDTAKYTPFIGLFTTYTTPFSLGVVGGTDLLTLRSESFLGREPIRDEVYSQICNAMRAVTGGGCNLQSTFDDNGG